MNNDFGRTNFPTTPGRPSRSFRGTKLSELPQVTGSTSQSHQESFLLSQTFMSWKQTYEPRLPRHWCQFAATARHLNDGWYATILCVQSAATALLFLTLLAIANLQAASEVSRRQSVHILNLRCVKCSQTYCIPLLGLHA